MSPTAFGIVATAWLFLLLYRMLQRRMMRRGGHLKRRCPMHVKSETYDLALSEARHLRARAIVDFWQRLRDAISPHVPKLFPSEF